MHYICSLCGKELRHDGLFDSLWYHVSTHDYDVCREAWEDSGGDIDFHYERYNPKPISEKDINIAEEVSRVIKELRAFEQEWQDMCHSLGTTYESRGETQFYQGAMDELDIISSQLFQQETHSKETICAHILVLSQRKAFLDDVLQRADDSYVRGRIYAIIAANIRLEQLLGFIAQAVFSISEQLIARDIKVYVR